MRNQCVTSKRFAVPHNNIPRQLPNSKALNTFKPKISSMKFTVIASMEELDSVKTKGIVLSFRPSIEDIIAIHDQKIKVIQISPASEKSLNANARRLVELLHMTLQVGSVKGIRKDRHGCVIDIT